MPRCDRESAPRAGQNFKAKLSYAGTVAEFYQLDHLMEKFHVIAINIDIRPETQKATELCMQAKQTTYLTDYARQEPGHVLVSGLPRRISANRTDVIDQVVREVPQAGAAAPSQCTPSRRAREEGVGEYSARCGAQASARAGPTQQPAGKMGKGPRRKRNKRFHADTLCSPALYRSYGRIEAFQRTGQGQTRGRKPGHAVWFVPCRRC